MDTCRQWKTARREHNFFKWGALPRFFCLACNYPHSPFKRIQVREMTPLRSGPCTATKPRLQQYFQNPCRGTRQAISFLRRTRVSLKLLKKKLLTSSLFAAAGLFFGETLRFGEALRSRDRLLRGVRLRFLGDRDRFLGDRDRFLGDRDRFLGEGLRVALRGAGEALRKDGSVLNTDPHNRF
jgi:hypothetical protein